VKIRQTIRIQRRGEEALRGEPTGVERRREVSGQRGLTKSVWSFGSRTIKIAWLVCARRHLIMLDPPIKAQTICLRRRTAPSMPDCSL
jgi:hypothetical protein